MTVQVTWLQRTL